MTDERKHGNMRLEGQPLDDDGAIEFTWTQRGQQIRNAVKQYSESTTGDYDMTVEPKCPLCGGSPDCSGGRLNYCDECGLQCDFWCHAERLVEAAAILDAMTIRTESGHNSHKLVVSSNPSMANFVKRFYTWKAQEERDARCTCPTLNDQKVTGSSCPLHGLPSKPFDTTDERSERDE